MKTTLTFLILTLSFLNAQAFELILFNDTNQNSPEIRRIDYRALEEDGFPTTNSIRKVIRPGGSLKLIFPNRDEDFFHDFKIGYVLFNDYDLITFKCGGDPHPERPWDFHRLECCDNAATLNISDLSAI